MRYRSLQTWALCLQAKFCGQPVTSEGAVILKGVRWFEQGPRTRSTIWRSKTAW